jgi:hypothetical protein
MAAKFFVGLELDDPDPECVKGHAEPLLAAVGHAPAPSPDHSRPGAADGPVPVRLGTTRRR